MRLKFFAILLVLLCLTSVIFFNQSESQVNVRKEGSKIDIIVIDAGHGGKDPGSTSITKIPEKNYNLLIAKYLAEMLRKEYSDMEVYMTRDDDTFIDLKERGRIANSKKGKLFVSIHCNSKLPEESDKSGFEVYVLSPTKTNDAVKITQGENQLLRDNMDSLRGRTAFQNDFILSSMLTNVYRRYSERFASIIQTELTKTTQLENRGIKEEEFIVNWTASMPSVLIECGFLSNKKDEGYLRSKDGQYDIARSVYKAIRYYKMDYEWENGY